jgi:hypothetical protein
LIPVLNGFIILDNPDNPANLLLGFFLVLSFIVDVIVTGYAVKYVVMQQSKLAGIMIGRLQKDHTRASQAIEVVNHEMQAVRMSITNLATEFRTVYESMVTRGEKPTIVIPLPYVFVLNRRIWYTDVLPIQQITITEPTGSVAGYSSFWDASMAVDLPPSRMVEDYETRALNDAALPHTGSDSFFTNGASAATPNNAPAENAGKVPAPSLGEVISDSEKYV